MSLDITDAMVERCWISQDIRALITAADPNR